MRPLLALAALVTGSLLAPASAHRMPDVYIGVERAEVSGEAVSVLTVRMAAEDALVLATERFTRQADLGSEEVLAYLGARAAAKITASASLNFYGGEFEDAQVFLYLVGPEGLVIEKTSVLSSVYDAWTNYLDDERAPGAQTRMFTQKGQLPPHRH